MKNFVTALGTQKRSPIGDLFCVPLHPHHHFSHAHHRRHARATAATHTTTAPARHRAPAPPRPAAVCSSVERRAPARRGSVARQRPSAALGPVARRQPSSCSPGCPIPCPAPRPAAASLVCRAAGASTGAVLWSGGNRAARQRPSSALGPVARRQPSSCFARHAPRD